MASSISRRNFLFGAFTTAALTASVALGGCSISATSNGGSSSSGDSSASTSGYRTLDEIKESGKIVIGVFSDKSPFGYVDENGEYQGYDVELARQIGTDLGVEVEFVSTEAANRVEYLETNKVDLILANFTVTEERAEKVDFAEAYMNVALGVVSHKDNVVTDLSQVGDRTVIVISGTTAETYLTEHNPDLKLEKYDTYAAAKTAFENNKDAVWANDNTEVIAFAKSSGTDEYVVGIEELGDKDTIAPAVAKGNDELFAWVNDELYTLGGKKFFHTDYEKTLLSTYGADYEDTLVVEPTK
ncbi:substrate-binding domain-containing protein [Paratractidigestivibacter sp.]|uniref:substrate-binding domain-containing protein n=1 Tax=Paratractidigestivibacter sp. TaxID=2847316 RepID=UPI002ABE0F52|nr:substrate-binding domain-containing protein [Paratractidigestivibacter sp.]